MLVCTSTLAWGVNFPAHLVVVKGTEFFDGKSQRYVDFPITDLLQVGNCSANHPKREGSGRGYLLRRQPLASSIIRVLPPPTPTGEAPTHDA